NERAESLNRGTEYLLTHWSSFDRFQDAPLSRNPSAQLPTRTVTEAEPFRHAWATRAFAQGQGLKTVADLMGHRSLESTHIYTKVDCKQLRSVGLGWPEEVRS